MGSYKDDAESHLSRCRERFPLEAGLNQDSREGRDEQFRGKVSKEEKAGAKAQIQEKAFLLASGTRPAISMVTEERPDISDARVHLLLGWH